MPDENEEVTNLEFDIETLTLLQVAFLEEYTGFNKAELIKHLEHPDLMPTTITIGIIAISSNPTDPKLGQGAAEQMKVVDL